MSYIVAEYRCPLHGIFEETVERPAPDEMRCPESMFADRPCGTWSPWCISAPKPKVLSVPCYASSSGGDLKDRPPGMLDTRPLAEGMSMTEWKDKQRDAQRTRRHKMLIDKGAIQKKITVG